jgi:hypothetical protein
MPSWTRAPPESLMKTNGVPHLSADSIISDDLLAVRLAGRAAHDGEVLAGDVDGTAQHRAGAGDDTVGGHVGLVHAEGDRPVAAEQRRLLEEPSIQEGVDALARGQLALARAASASRASPPPDARLARRWWSSRPAPACSLASWPWLSCPFTADGRCDRATEGDLVA